eukprot:453433_1
MPTFNKWGNAKVSVKLDRNVRLKFNQGLSLGWQSDRKTVRWGKSIWEICNFVNSTDKQYVQTFKEQYTQSFSWSKVYDRLKNNKRNTEIDDDATFMHEVEEQLKEWRHFIHRQIVNGKIKYDPSMKNDANGNRTPSKTPSKTTKKSRKSSKKKKKKRLKKYW